MDGIKEERYTTTKTDLGNWLNGKLTLKYL